MELRGKEETSIHSPAMRDARHEHQAPGNSNLKCKRTPQHLRGTPSGKQLTLGEMFGDGLAKPGFSEDFSLWILSSARFVLTGGTASSDSSSGRTISNTAAFLDSKLTAALLREEEGWGGQAEPAQPPLISVAASQQGWTQVLTGFCKLPPKPLGEMRPKSFTAVTWSTGFSVPDWMKSTRCSLRLEVIADGSAERVVTLQRTSRDGRVLTSCRCHLVATCRAQSWAALILADSSRTF